MRFPSVALAALAAASVARAQPPPAVVVVAVEADDAGVAELLAQALAPQLAGAGVATFVVPDRIGAPVDAAAAARAIAERRGAMAVVWIGRGEAHRALYVYSRESDRLLPRDLGAVPEGPDLIAEAALLASATLRASVFDALPQPPLPLPPPRAPATVRAPAAPPAPVAAAPAPPRRPYAIDFSAGYRMQVLPSLGVAHGAAIEVAVTAARRRLGGDFAAAVLAPIDVGGDGFHGRLLRVPLDLDATARYGRAVAVVGRLGPRLTISRLEGTLDSGAARSDVEVELALHAACGARVALPYHISVEVGLGTALALRRPRYLVDGGEAVAIPLFSLETSASLAVDLP